ncbi:MAG TPA: hypothetical protein VK929_11470 [Longimicrobiales bacterium]|nr:hypothetical protein [Longimicrobiales bacterium]
MSRRDLTWAVIAALLTAAGCSRADGESEQVAELAAEAAQTVTADTAVYVGDGPRETLPSNRIYYSLTRHDWYARGEPLLHDGRSYRATGMPVRADVPEMQPLGDYHGVEYYARPDDSNGALYVPVFEGYWQPFRPDTTPTGNVN